MTEDGQPVGDIERLSALIQVKLSDLERKTSEGEVPSTAELNAVRRLVLWAERERQFAKARELSRPKRA